MRRRTSAKCILLQTVASRLSDDELRARVQALSSARATGFGCATLSSWLSAYQMFCPKRSRRYIHRIWCPEERSATKYIPWPQQNSYNCTLEDLRPRLLASPFPQHPLHLSYVSHNNRLSPQSRSRGKQWKANTNQWPMKFPLLHLKIWTKPNWTTSTSMMHRY